MNKKTIQLNNSTSLKRALNKHSKAWLLISLSVLKYQIIILNILSGASFICPVQWSPAERGLCGAKGAEASRKATFFDVGLKMCILNRGVMLHGNFVCISLCGYFGMWNFILVVTNSVCLIWKIFLWIFMGKIGIISTFYPFSLYDQRFLL